MSYERLLRIREPFFAHYDIAHVLGIKLASAEVLCTRYVKKGLLTRLKRGLYAKTETLAHMGQADLFRIANTLQVPSYISLNTALAYYGMTKRDVGGYFESISVMRTRRFQTGKPSFQYIKIRPDLYGGFVRMDGFVIACPEKAVLDSFYLASLGRYALDGSSLDLTKLDEERLAELSAPYPMKARKYLERYYAKRPSQIFYLHNEQLTTINERYQRSTG